MVLTVFHVPSHCAFIGFLDTAYRLYTVVPKLVRFVGMLTNWYVRFNRKRLKVSSTLEIKQRLKEHDLGIALVEPMISCKDVAS